MGMSFFDVPVPAPEDAWEPPVWWGPPRGVLPGLSTQRAVVFRTAEVLLAADGFSAYPNGILFSLALWERDGESDKLDFPWEPHSTPSGVLSGEFLRFGIEFGDGTKWTNLNWSLPDEESEPTGPVVFDQGGKGGGASWESTYWVWPLPPPGDLTLVAEWPIHGIEETRVILDADELRERAAESEVIWPE